MDDYGTGNASSSIVLGVPMNEIKIDMSFIKGILNNEKQQMLVKNIVNFARSTNMKSCIEGVEDKSLQDYLRSFGATWFQGYYYSKPVGEEQLKEAGVQAELVRISLGLEDKEDLIADISQALDAIAE